MLKNLKIGTKLALAFLAIALIFIIAGVVFLIESQHALSQATFRQLESLRADKKAQLDEFFAEHNNDIQMLVDSVALLRQNAFQKLELIREGKKSLLEQYFHERLNDAIRASQSVSISPALSQFEAAEEDNESSQAKTWRAVEQKLNVELSQFKDEHDYHSLFLIAKDGDIVYSTSKEVEIGKNLHSSKFKNSSLGRAFKNSSNGAVIQDFAPNVLSDGNSHVAFVAAPVLKDGQFLGVLVLCILPDQINTIVQQRQGLEKTGEAYLVGELNGQTGYRSDRVIKGEGKNVIGVEKTGEDITKALAGQSGTKIKIGSTGDVEITSYAPLNIPGLKWAIIVTLGLKETLTLTKVGEEEDLFAKYIAHYGYNDAFLILPQGHIFHTVQHDSDYNTNLMTGEYANSGLGQVVREVLKTKTFGISDYAPYAPSHGEMAAFIALPLIVEDTVAMVVASQISDVRIDEIMHQRDGMGETGEAYLVGSDKLMRSNSIHAPATHSMKASFANPAMGVVDSEASNKALSGETGIEIIAEYHDANNFVLSAYTPLKVGQLTWALLVEIDEVEAFAAVTELKWWLGIIILVSLAVIIGIALLITQNIKRPLGHLVEISQIIAAGNLNNDIVVTGKDEMAQLLQAFADMQAKLHTVVMTIQRAAGIVNTSAEEIAQSNVSLSQRTEQQAASLEETAASMEEMTSSVQQNADNANTAKQLASSAKDLASKGGEVVGTAINAMTGINTSSRKVTEIIGVIDEIAFQTNLLALNAAVEAARAGEQGRGFAVVASEVRNLAQRSAAAAKEIKGLIQDSVTKVEEGTQLVNESGKTLAEIVTSVKKVSDIVSEIAAASVEQASGINQVNKVITQMDEMVQQNAAAVEETASASESLKDRAQNLTEQVAFFNVGEQTLPPPIEKTNIQLIAKHTHKTAVSPAHSTSKSTLDNDGWEDF